MTQKEENEDGCYADGALAFVMDGASGLSPFRISDHASDAAWYTDTLKHAVLKYRNLPELKDVLRCALDEVNTRYRQFEGFSQITDFPSAVIAMARVKKQDIQFLVLGDCICLLETKDNKILRIADERLQAFDQKALRYGMERCQKEHLDFCDARPFYQKILVENRRMKNKEGGYYCLSDQSIGIEHAYTAQYPLSELNSMILMSDGFAQLIDLFHLYEDTTIFSAIREKKTTTLMQELKDAQEKDRKSNQYPRFSFRDDATIVYAHM